MKRIGKASFKSARSSAEVFGSVWSKFGARMIFDVGWSVLPIAALTCWGSRGLKRKIY